ncbi:glycosyltransferase (plasmid) [Solibacillus silvestris StLB046]|uniref:Glycosyltransferase n=2 Tax=Solibacillus silvestris TaxID=76853 RepID=F2FAU9_SOLSS|nr:glycosyltransferase [Solibacillus silvestris StLB046]
MTALLTLTTALASETGDTFIKVYDAVMNIVDHGVVLIIIFTGVNWMLDHRSKGIELLMSGAIGYIIVMHAIDIRNFLKELSAP